MDNTISINGKLIDEKDLCEQLSAYGLWDLVEDISDDGDGEMQLTEDGEKVYMAVKDMINKLKNKSNG